MRYVSEYVQHEVFDPGVEDDRGEVTDGWAAPVSVGIYGFDPGSTSEPREGQDRVIVSPTIYAPSGAVFGPFDRVTVRGKSYQVEGETREWRHPDGHRPGNVVTLRRVDG